MSLEQQGVPTVAVHTHVFARLAKSVALANGMPTTRQAFVPQPVVDKTPSELRAYIEGADPVSKRPFMQELIEAISGPLSDDDLKGMTFERSTPRLLEPDTEGNLHALFEKNSWTDHLPIVLPTEERVAAMLKGTKRRPDEVVGQLSPTAFREAWQFTVEKVAVNAVMAGARPEYLPVILAMAASGSTARSSSTTSFCGIAVVNGPIRDEIGMSSGIGVMGPFNHANATIGRAWNLLCQNLQGGSLPGDTYMGTLGNWYSYSAAFPEADERSPWEPLHTRYGFKRSDSAVTVFRGGRYTLCGFGPRETWQEKFKRVFAACAPRQSPLIVMDPIVARLFKEHHGYNSKEQLTEWIAKNCTLPAREYWDDQWVQTLLHPLAVAGVEPYASNLKALKADPHKELEIFRPEEIHIVVAGGETQGAWKAYEAVTRGKKASVSIDEWR